MRKTNNVKVNVLTLWMGDTVNLPSVCATAACMRAVHQPNRRPLSTFYTNSILTQTVNLAKK